MTTFAETLTDEQLLAQIRLQAATCEQTVAREDRDVPIPKHGTAFTAAWLNATFLQQAVNEACDRGLLPESQRF